MGERRVCKFSVQRTNTRELSESRFTAVNSYNILAGMIKTLNQVETKDLIFQGPASRAVRHGRWVCLCLS